MSPSLPQERVDSAYGTDSNRTGSPPQPKTDQGASPNSSNGSSVAFNNDTYMNTDTAVEMFKNSKKQQQQPTVNNSSNIDKSDDNTYMSVHIQNSSDDAKLLKRSPVVRDVTSGFAHISNTEQLIRRKMTILVPSLEKTISLEALNPTKDQISNVSNHDYENLALININRNLIGNYNCNSAANNHHSSKVTHWRTYSNMADGNHDESTAYEKRNYYDIYPLSKELKEQLYRSLTPLSTAATMASDSIGMYSDLSNKHPGLLIYYLPKNDCKH